MTAATDVAASGPLVILVVDDDRNSRETLKRALERDGHRVVTAENGKQALALAREDAAVDLVVTDLIMPGLDGLDFLQGFRVLRPEVPAILISAFANVDTAVKAVRQGVVDVVEKPFRLRDIRRAIRLAAETRRLWVERSRLREAAEAAAPVMRDAGPRALVGQSGPMARVRDLVARVAPVKSTVLVLGESGTGKELVAEAVHRSSRRALGPLVKVACAALAESVLEAELFGHEKGAFTGAHERRIGRFEAAHGGTIFLDEIGELSPGVQVKLLRVLQEGEFERVGGSESLRVDVRVIAATNRDLAREVAEHRFREDLYWRLNVIAIEVPPLRERREDVPALCEHFLAKSSRATGREGLTFDAETLRILAGHPWPGNVRQLENTVERAVVLARGPSILPEDLPEGVLESSRRGGLVRFEVGETLEGLEREAILRTLEAVDGNREAAASILGIGVATLYRRLREIDVAEPDQPDLPFEGGDVSAPPSGPFTGP